MDIRPQVTAESFNGSHHPSYAQCQCGRHGSSAQGSAGAHFTELRWHEICSLLKQAKLHGFAIYYRTLRQFITSCDVGIIFCIHLCCLVKWTPFPTIFSNDFCIRVVKKWIFLGKWLVPLPLNPDF